MPRISYDRPEAHPTTARTIIWDPSLLDTVERTLRQLCEGPAPLAIDGKAIGNGLPARLIPLTELRAILLHPSADRTTRDAAWRELITQARTYGDAWTIGCVGVALPGLRHVISTLSRATSATDRADITAEVVIGFVHALDDIDLDRPRIMLRLCRIARKAGQRARWTDVVPVSPDTILRPMSAPPAGHPDLLLADAVEQGIITRFEAQVIGTTRLEDVNLTDVAEALGLGYDALRKRRSRAEARLRDAILDGRVSTKIHDSMSDPAF
ncbi:hypothetical protein [Microtetraspora sp. NBRC 16547]|uniref:hypothetical protein n=1 Tax=Microtetraspora sp. NBRC 16547 TaxID=3030993 RepID=UPI0024A152E8|nr:hypothetical protein [Microtetraspora sp. NBRC 16547]GLW98797.1 hypothetical protein Misp02_28840 [Microtetraspora sp. NBRC 16547]